MAVACRSIQQRASSVAKTGVVVPGVLKRSVKGALRRAGYEVIRADRTWTIDAALRRLVARHDVRSVLDVGASDGRWTLLARAHLPHATFVLIEAQAAVHGPALEALARATDGIEVVLAAAGDHSGTIHFAAADAFGGAASEQPYETADTVVPMTTIDAEVARLHLSPPYFLKLDTHGFERQILEGASAALAETTLLQIEVYNFELQPGAFRFHELCSYLDQRGFRPVDVADLMRRPGDGVFWQCDLFFARSDRPEFARTSYA